MPQALRTMDPFSFTLADETMKNCPRDKDCTGIGLTRREFLVTALLASGAVVMGSYG